MTWPIDQHVDGGLFSVALRSCTVEVVTTFLPTSGSTMWLRDHYPHTEMAWASVTVPLSIHGDWEPEPEPTYHAVEVRGLLFDVQFPVERFGELLPALRDHGANLYGSLPLRRTRLGRTAAWFG